MSPQDQFDEELRNRFQSGEYFQTGARRDLEQLQPRFRRARRNRQLVTATASMAAALLVVVVGASALSGTASRQIVDVADDSLREQTREELITEVPVSSLPDNTLPDSPRPNSPLPNNPDSEVSSDGFSVSTVPSDGSGAAYSGGSPPTETNIGSDSPVSAPVAVPDSVPQPAVTQPPITQPAVPPAGGTTTLSAEGGTATVLWTASSVQVLATAPSAGWELERREQNSPTEIEVRFRRDGGGSGSSNSTIKARVENGRLRVSP